MEYCKRHEYYFSQELTLQCDKCQRLLDQALEAIDFYANQLLDYNEVVAQELLADKGQKARDVLLAVKTK